MAKTLALPGMERPNGRGVGPVYQGVCRAIRHVESDGDKDAKELRAGLVAQARSLAGSIDRVSGHEPGSYQAQGDKLAQMHERLAALMILIAPGLQAPPSVVDPFADALNHIFDSAAAHDDTTTPHTA